MKANIKFPEYLAGLLLFLSFLLPVQVKAQYDDITLETFYEELSPYGAWINDPQYGYVWRPNVDQDDFRPYYTNGRWEMTRYGNTWVSDYEWGWAPFHYGRWQHSNRRGWLWVPDTRWGPAWVSWRSGGGYYGWAPLGPGININIRSRIPDYYWVFVPQRNIYYDRYPRYDRYRNRNIYNNTIIINNTYVYNRNRYYTGPRVDEIRRVTRQPVRINDVRDNRPTNYGSDRNDRPQVNRTPDRGGNPGQNPRPDRPIDNSGGRGAVSGRGTEPVIGNSGNRGTVRPESRQIPASSQRSGRTYDNQDNRGSQINQGGQGSIITERQQEQTRQPQVQAPREQRRERVGQATPQSQTPERVQRNAPQERQALAPERVQRSDPQERQAPASERIQRSAPQDRQDPAQSRQSSEVRENSSSEQENSRGGQNRPSRGN